VLDRLRARFGPAADAWWAAMPALRADLAVRWGLVLGEPVGRGNTSLVLRATRDGVPVILKLAVEPGLGRIEARALRSWAPSGRVPTVLADDESSGALLLEALPDVAPAAVTVHDVAGLIGDLHRAGDPAGFPPLSERVAFIFGTGPGHELARRLAAEPVEAVLLHGDLHPANVLDAGRLVAIDPRPGVGDPAFDAVDWVDRAGLDVDDLGAALAVDPARIRAWSAAFADWAATRRERWA
jgi:streptomycin 6-kinase